MGSEREEEGEGGAVKWAPLTAHRYGRGNESVPTGRQCSSQCSGTGKRSGSGLAAYATVGQVPVGVSVRSMNAGQGRTVQCKNVEFREG